MKIVALFVACPRPAMRISNLASVEVDIILLTVKAVRGVPNPLTQKTKKTNTVKSTLDSRVGQLYIR